MKKILTVIVGMLILILFINKMFHKDIWDENRELLKEKIIEMKDSEPVSLSSITPFEWDRVYSFAPYVSNDEVYSTVGYKWDEIQETVSEGMNQLVFMKDDKVVCYVYGYPDKNGFGIYFERSDTDGMASVVDRDDDVLFERHVFENAVVYMQVNE